MIRPSPTGISLSSQDVSLYLQQLDIYQGLLEQGFKKKEIHKYFQDQRTNAIRDAQSSSSITSLSAPTNVDFATRTRKLSAGETLGSATSKTSQCSDGKLIGGLIRESCNYSDRCKPARHESSLNISASTTADLLPARQVQRNTSRASDLSTHAPRRASLLRFSNNVSSDEIEDVKNFNTRHFSPRSQIRYRPRTQTHSYEQSEIDDDDGDDDDDVHSCSLLGTVFEALSLDDSLVPATKLTLGSPQLRSNAEECSPPAVSSPQSIISQLSPDRTEHPIEVDKITSYTPPLTDSAIVPALVCQGLDKRYPESTFSLASPSCLDIKHSAFQRGLQRYSSPALPALLSTPTPLSRAHDPHTEPQDNRFRYLDGPSFTPYNDSFPASMQPQTPADLARQPLVGETNAAYTAPPGRLRHDVIAEHLEHGSRPQYGEESPTDRAISIRQRRNREYARSARIEGLRISRRRRRIQPQDDEAEVYTGHIMAPWEIEDHFNLWRDDLDADRVGEENFEDTIPSTDSPGTGMRVVSGNRRAYGD